MKRKLVYFLYSGYIVFLVGLLGSRFANSISKGTLNIICLFIFIGVLAFCCGGFVGYPTRQIDTEQTIKDNQRVVYNDNSVSNYFYYQLFLLSLKCDNFFVNA